MNESPDSSFIPQPSSFQLSFQQLHDDILDADDVVGKRIVSTRLQHNVTIREENATAALEVMSRFAANPKWLIYLQYCWTVESLNDLKLAPFHLLATEGSVHTNQNHVWHMETLAKVCREDADLLLATEYKVIHLSDAGSVSHVADAASIGSVESGIDWWTDLTGRGGEGMVVKPVDWIMRGKKGLVQPAVKCRGKEYLRIIYSPDYDSAENLPRLRSRSLGRKRSLALREFALGIEGLERFVRKEPLRRVHECVFGVLAMESEPVDPRL